MNAPIIDPLQGDFPEVIEEYLEHSIMKCISFNRPGTLLAAGCSDGSCVIWDFETRGIAKELRDKDCVAAITSVCWSRNGHNILISAADKSLTLWDVVKGEKIYRITLQQTPLQARLHPLESTLCLICPFSSAPIIVDLHTETTTTLPISLSEKPAPASKNKFSDGSAHYTPTAACFNKHGDLVYVGNSVGEILIIDHKLNQVCGIVPVSGGAVIKNIVFSRDGQFLLTNSSDRTIRIYENRLKSQDSHQLVVNEDSKNEVETLKAAGTNCLSLFREFQDSITKVHWKAPCFSGDGEWVIGGSASKGEHKIYIWDRQAGHLVKILEGPKEALMDLVWHPVHPIVVSVSLTGLVYIWAKDYTENWSAFAPDFKELEENEEYVEREDEFDLMPETEKVKESVTNEEDEVDITTVEKDSAFSDSEEELCFLPADPCPDVVSGDKHTARPDNSSPLSEDNNGYSNQIEGTENSGGEDTGGVTHLKRRRKPSEKVLEQQQAQKAQKTKASTGKSLKTKSKEEENDMNHFGDENGIDD